MSNTLIKSESFVKRNAKLSFFLSLICSGFGQLYNGDLSKSIGITFLQAFLFLIYPIVLILTDDTKYVFLLLILIILSVFIFLYSVLNALFTAKHNPQIIPKWYNSKLFYFIFFITNRSLVALSVIVFFSFISFEKLTTDEMYPTLLKDEVVLISNVDVSKIKVSDIILLNKNNKNNIYRVVATDLNKIVSYKKNKLTIDNQELQWGVLTEKQLISIGLANDENIFTEKNLDKFYLVTSNQQKNQLDESLNFRILSDHFVLISDNRKNSKPTQEKLPKVIKRVEGIIFSKNYKRLIKNVLFFE